MLHAVELQNFKGVSGRIRIELGPLTLLFGANNAGKSTILQSLLYVLNVLETGDPDVDRTHLGGDAVDLGGFVRLLHQHDLSRTMVIRVEFDTPSTLNCFDRDLEDFPYPDLDDTIEKVWLELRMQWLDTPVGRRAFLMQVLIGVPEERVPLLTLSLVDENAGNVVTQFWRAGESVRVRLNFNHPILDPRDIDEALDAMQPNWMDERDGHLLFALAHRADVSALPPLSEPVRLIPMEEEDEGLKKAGTSSAAETLIEMLVIGTTRQLVDTLRGAIYVGPLRAIPPRGFLSERSGHFFRWVDGLAAWELLLSDDRLLAQTNEWLNRFGAGCVLAIQELFDPSASAEEIAAPTKQASARRLFLKTGTGTSVLPSEVGVGISQVIPVIVASLIQGSQVGMFEQPELHIHPALQTGLGDLFIAASRSRQCLVETHSEHLVLRVLRRIREAGRQVDATRPADHGLHEAEAVAAAFLDHRFITDNSSGHVTVPFSKLVSNRWQDFPSFSPELLSVLYLDQTPDGTTVRRLRVDATGEFVDLWPHGFFEEREKELF